MPPVEATGDLTAGTTLLGRYRIDGVLGRGGMGVVYAAHHTFMDQRVALKLLSSQAVASPDAAQRFLNEARNAAKIPGENVCRILDVGLLETGLPYIAMEYLEGKTLEAVAAERRFVEPSELSHWVLEALLAVAHAHARGIIHRDLKPSNLQLALREDGSTVVKVLDFGISKSMSPNQAGLTSTRSFLGSPAYMAPENIRSPRTVDTRADIWSLGVVLYELSSGAQPYDGTELGELLAAILEREPVPLASRRKDIPPDFCDIVHRCLAKNRDWRFQTVAELAAALAPYAGPEGSALAERVRKALALGAESKARGSLADNSGSLPAVATVTGSGMHSAPSGAAARPAGSVGSASSSSRGDVPATQASAGAPVPIVAITGTALTHSTAQRIRGRRSVAWIAGGAGLLCGVGIAMILVLSARHRMPPPVAPAAMAASTAPTVSPPPAVPAAVAPLPDEPRASGAGAPASPGESAALPAPIAPSARTPSAPSAAAAAATTHRPRTPQRPSAKPSGLSTSRD